VFVDRETSSFQGPIPCGVHQYPPVVDPDTAGQVMRNGKIVCQLAEFMRIPEVRVVPVEGKCGIDYLKAQSLVHLCK
jgi:hypothetical protein